MKNWKQLLCGAALILGSTFVSPASAITCTVTDPDFQGTLASASRAGSVTTIDVANGTPSGLTDANCTP